jgi:hypothetical protein
LPGISHHQTRPRDLFAVPYVPIGFYIEVPLGIARATFFSTFYAGIQGLLVFQDKTDQVNG